MAMPSRRSEREMRAKHTLHRAIPEILRASPRAKYGISQTDLLVDPQPLPKTPTAATVPICRSDMTIRIQSIDTLQAAARVSYRPFAVKRTVESRRANDTRSNVTVLNMASLTRPGGGFLAGANGQEEFLCARTTLYASLWDDFYTLPDLGGVFTPDVLVFRDSSIDAIDLAKRDRFFVNVISAGVPRHPDNRGRADERSSGCSCGVSYCDRDRDIMIRKMKAVMRVAQIKGTEKLILGAWGCGALNHPVREVAKLWRKVIAGGPRQRRPNSEQWDGINEITFAIPNMAHAREFRRAFDDVLAPDLPAEHSPSAEQHAEVEDEDAEISKLIATISSLELQIELSKSSLLRNRLRQELATLNRELAQGRAAKASREDYVDEDKDVEDDYVVSGFQASDGEDNDFYRVDGTSDSESDGAKSEVYEFRFGAPLGFDSQTSHDEDESQDEGSTWATFPPSPQFDPQTGWFQGSIDQLTAHVYGKGRMKGGSISPRSPLVRPESSATNSETVVNAFLSRFQQSDADQI